MDSSKDGPDARDTLPPHPGPSPATTAPAPGPLGDLPQRAGRYLVQEKIAQGGMGVVLRVRDPDFERPLAVKVLLPQTLDRAEAERRFLEEAKITAQLQHPGIPPVHERGTLEDGLPFFAMKLIQGRTLAELLEDHPPGTMPVEPRLLGIFRQVVQTMAYAHSKGILHRDLKPANVMVGAFGEVQVMDWGLAKVLPPHPPSPPLPQGARGEQDLCLPLSPPWERGPGGEGATQSGAVLGTPGYMAPEQARGEVDLIDERCDVFGLGAILCEVLTGKPPFRHADTLARLIATAEGNLADAFARLDACGADAELVGLCQRCLARDKDERPRHAGVVAEAVEGYEALVQQRLRQAELQREKALVQAAGERRRRRVTLTAAAAVVLLVCGAAGGTLWYVREQGERANRHERRRQGLGDALEQARAARAELHARLGRPGGVFGLLNRPGEWLRPLESARFALRRAADLAAGAEMPIDPELRRQMDDLHAQLDRDEAERRQALQLEKVREDRSTVVEGHFDNARADRGYQAAFEQAGMAVLPGQEERLAALVRSSRIREQLLAALDNWAYVAWLRGKQDLQRRLLQVARRADPDSWKDQVRDPALWNDPRALKRLARASAPGPISPQMLDLLGNLLGSREEGEKWLRRGIALHPSDFWLHFSLGTILEKPRPHQAEGFFRSALALRPQSVAAHHSLGSVLLAQKDTDGARRHFHQALALAPNEPKVHNSLGLTLHEAKDLQGAIASFEKALALEPDDAHAHSNLGSVLRDCKDLPGAVKCFEKALALDPRLARALTNLGLVRLDQKDLPGAAECFQKALRLDPRLPQAHTNLGKLLYDRKDLKGASQCFRKALQVDPGYALAHYNLGVVLHDWKDLGGAIRHYQQAIALDPSDAQPHYNLGNALRELKDLEGASRHYRRAIALDPKDARAHHNLGVVLHKQNDLPGAIRHYRQALAIDPRMATAHNSLGLVLRDQKDPRGASECFQKALDIDPGYAGAHYNRGLVLHALKDLTGAARHYRQALDLDPSFAPAHTNLGNVLRERKDLDGALRHYHQALRLDPRLVQAHFGLGVALRDRKDLKGAAASLRRAIEISPQTSHAHLVLGLVLKEQGEFSAAAASYRRVLELVPSGHSSYALAQQRVKQCQRLLTLEDRLPLVLRGGPAGAAEKQALAELCLRYKKRPADAVELYAAAFAAQPGLAEDRTSGSRFDAARAALLAPEQADGKRLRFRRQALTWLRAELRAWQKTPASAALVRKALEQWQTDADLAGVRDEKALARLPTEERRAWQELWTDVAGLLRRARSP